tara:strand:- start:50 stop:670 length:621 start_codon:yes stop_codon:yes gene_type:complete
MNDDSWVPVRDEPRHRHRFENNFARVYDVLVPSGDATLYHHHTEDTLYVAIAPASLRDQTWGETDTRAAQVEAGICICRPHRTRPLIHRVRNVGQGDMRMIGVEVKASPPETSVSPLEASNVAMRWENERLRAYDVALEPGAATDELDCGFHGVAIMLTSACLAFESDTPEIWSAAAGDLVWLTPGQRRFRNVGEAPLSFVLAEWR